LLKLRRTRFVFDFAWLRHAQPEGGGPPSPRLRRDSIRSLRRDRSKLARQAIARENQPVFAFALLKLRRTRFVFDFAWLRHA